MRRSNLSLLALIGVLFVTDAVLAGDSTNAGAVWPPQLQLELRVPFEPTSFASSGKTHLIYELYVANFDDRPVELRRIEIRDADNPERQALAVLEGASLNPCLHHLGKPIVGDEIPAADANQERQIAPGETSVVFISVALAPGISAPIRLLHRVLTDGSAIDGALIGTHHETLKVLGPPVEGAHWLAGSGPSNDSHHRRQILFLDGRSHISSRYAIDWMRIEGGTGFSGDARSNQSYYAYGKPVLAVADARVVSVKNGIPENIPGHFGAGRIAVPMNLETFFGNTITLDLGGGIFAYYAHLQPDSLSVKVGDRVLEGQILARIGNTGSSFEPHLHFEVTTSAQVLRGEGVPYLIDSYTVRTMGSTSADRRTNELPLEGMSVDF